ncbi:MAG: hypothetical protein ACHQ1D_00145 [Nitrososphaerales archaeon]
MKKTLAIFSLLIISSVSFSQKKLLTEREVIQLSHLDFSKEVILFTLSGMLEIDGHVFKNDTCKCPIMYFADLCSVSIRDTCNGILYEKRKCNTKDCKILHLKYSGGLGQTLGDTGPGYAPRWEVPIYRSLKNYTLVPGEASDINAPIK